jgi:hypothetical protein
MSSTVRNPPAERFDAASSAGSPRAGPVHALTRRTVGSEASAGAGSVAVASEHATANSESAAGIASRARRRADGTVRTGIGRLLVLANEPYPRTPSSVTRPVAGA